MTDKVFARSFRAVNMDPETGIHYGVISQGSVSDFALDDIYQNGKDLRYDSQRQELIEQLQAAVADIADVTKPNELPQDVLGYIDDIADTLMEDHECDDCPRYYESEDVVVQTMPDFNTLWVFKSPITRKVRECSPCVPNAGDLDSGPGDIEAYALPDDWLQEGPASE